MEHPLTIDQEFADAPEYVQALYELRDRYIADRAAERASGITRVRRGGGRRRGTTTRTRARTTTETSMASLPPPPAEPVALQELQLNGNLPTESEVNVCFIFLPIFP